MNIIALVALEDVQTVIGEMIKEMKGDDNVDRAIVRIMLSTCEYLKDAQRWHYVQGNELPRGLSGQALINYIDAELNK